MGSILISTEKKKIDINLTHGFLSTSYWAKGRTLEEVKMSIENSFCFGVYLNDTQIGFARVITDTITFAYIADVFILQPHRGFGYSVQLMTAILSHSRLNKVKKWYLITKDAQGLYEKMGFLEYNYPERTIMFMASNTKVKNNDFK